MRRAIDLREGEKIDEAAFKQLIRAAVAANSAALAQRAGKEVSPAFAGKTKMSERSETLAAHPINDPFRGRNPTSHERMTGGPWDASYSDGPAPWNIGRPQPAIVRLASRAFAGRVLDAGCGTGEHSLLIASLGLPVLGPVLGVDVAETALAIAREKAAEKNASDSGIAPDHRPDHGVVEFATADALHLERLGAGLTRCWTADCSTPSTPTSSRATWRVWRR